MKDSLITCGLGRTCDLHREAARMPKVLRNKDAKEDDAGAPRKRSKVSTPCPGACLSSKKKKGGGMAGTPSSGRLSSKMAPLARHAERCSSYL